MVIEIYSYLTRIYIFLWIFWQWIEHNRSNWSQLELHSFSIFPYFSTDFSKPILGKPPGITQKTGAQKPLCRRGARREAHLGCRPEAATEFGKTWSLQMIFEDLGPGEPDHRYDHNGIIMDYYGWDGYYYSIILWLLIIIIIIHYYSINPSWWWME